MPDEKTCMNRPQAQVMTKSCQHRRRPNMSASFKEIKAPKAAPSTRIDEILAIRLARPAGSFFQFDGSRSKSVTKDFKVVEALNPPSS